MKKYFLVLLLGLLPLAASAQKETGLFLGAGAGMNFGFDGLKYDDRPTSHNGAGYAVDAYLGGWLNQTVGLRAGYQGLGISDRYTDFGNRKYNYFHGDVLLRVHRNIIPYVHGGYVSIVNPSFGGGAGIMLPIHLGKHVSIVPDLKANFYSSRAFDVFERNIATTLSATVGIAFRFGGKKKAVVPSTPIVPATRVIHDTVVVKETVREKETVVVRDTVYVQPEVRDPETISALALFDTDKSELRPEALPELDKIAAWFKAHPAARARIEGHTDNTASAAYNQALSEARAMAVYIYLVGKDVPADRLSTAGFGYSRPVATNATPEGRQQNRRVEIKVE